MNKLIININEKSQYWSNLFIWPIIATTIFFLHWTFDFTYTVYIGVLAYFIPIFFLNIRNCLTIYFFLLPNISMFKLSSDSIAFSSILIGIIFIKLIFNKKIRINPISLVLIFLFLISSLLTYFIAEDNLILFTQDIRFVLNIIVIISIINIYKTNLNVIYNSISNAFIFGCVFSSLTGLLYSILNNVIMIKFRMEAVNSDPNYYSLCLAFSISLILLKIYKEKINKIDLFLLIVFTVFGLLSLSRGFLVAMIVNFSFFVYLFVLTKKINIKRKIIFSMFFIIIVFFMQNILYELYLNLKERTFSEEYSGGSGRLEIWKAYLIETFSNLKSLFLGLGEPKLIYLTGNIAVQHNLYLELFTGRGILGTTIVILIYVKLANMLKGYLIVVERNQFASYLPILTLMVGFMFLNGLFSDIGIMTIFLALFAFNIYRSEY